MKNTFRYHLTLEDYISYNKNAYKKSAITASIISGALIAIISIYYSFLIKNTIILIGVVLSIIILAAYNFYMYNKGIEKRFIKMYGNCKFYFEEKEITVTPDSIESKNFPDAEGAGLVGIYPYSIMKVIYETDTLFVFVIGNEAKLMPKRAVPPEMQEEVFAMLRSRKKYMKLS